MIPEPILPVSKREYLVVASMLKAVAAAAAQRCLRNGTRISTKKALTRDMYSHG
jgi:hypothetical protein